MLVPFSKFIMSYQYINRYIFTLLLLLYIFKDAEGTLIRCFTCRSRGNEGDCKDEFMFKNASELSEDGGVSAVPCSSGWCAKVIDGGANLLGGTTNPATERLCMPRGPTDGEERCAFTTWKREKVFMCFCRGDLCNSAFHFFPSVTFISLLLMINYALYIS